MGTWSKETRELMSQDYSKIEEKRQRKMTLKQRKFLKHYLETGDAVASCMRAYAVRNRANAASLAHQVLKDLDFSLILEMAEVSDSQLAIKMKEGINATKINKKGEKVPDLEVRYKYIVTALEAKRKIKNKLEVTGENGQPIRFNILAGHGFIPPVSRPNSDNATSETSPDGRPTEIQNPSVAQTSEKDNNSNNRGG